MGIISSLKDRYNKQTETSRVEIKEVEMFHPQFRSKAKHNYGREITQIFTAKIKVNTDSYGEATILNDGDIPICIEIPENTKLEDILDDKMLEFLHSNGYFEGMSKDHYNMIGIVTIEDGEKKINEMSEKMINSIETLKLDEELEKEAEEFRRRFEEEKREWQLRDEMLNGRIRDKVIKERQEREEREEL